VRSEVHLEVRNQVVEKLGDHSFSHHGLIDGQGNVQGHDQIVGYLHIYLLLLNFKLVGICPSLGVTTDNLRDTGEDKEGLS